MTGAGRRITPMLATAGEVPANEDDWAVEVKWDGMRVIATISDGELRLRSRLGIDVTAQYPDLAPPPPSLARHDVILDGELVAFDQVGHPSFELLQPRMAATSPMRVKALVATHPVHLIAFDLLELDGDDLCSRAYVERRRSLDALVLPSASRWQRSEYRVGDARELLAASAALGLEGIVLKRLDSTYRPGQRSRDWRKVRVARRQEFVIGGWTSGRGSRAETFGALLLGYHDDDRLQFAGAVGGGFDDATLVRMRARLEPLARADSPFAAPIPKSHWGRHYEPSDLHFVEPGLVCEVSFAEFTSAGRLRHPVFRGMREDKLALDVVREPG